MRGGACVLLTAALCAYPSAAAGQTKAPSAAPAPVPESGFFFGTNGRAVVATDPNLRPGRDADIVRWGSRLDESTYLQMDAQRQDYWPSTHATTRAAILLAVNAPVFHYNSKWDIQMAVRNLFVEERDLWLKGLSVWVGSRMYRGDYSDLLDFWPLDWLNTIGGGTRYELPSGRTAFAVHAGVNQPDTAFFRQAVERPLTLNRTGTTTVDVLNRQRVISSFKATHIFQLDANARVKGVLYGELHGTSSGERETTTPGVFERMPRDSGYVLGMQVSVLPNKRDHLHLFVRYASGMAAYGEFGQPFNPAADGTSTGAHEMRVTWSGNIERGPLGVMVAGYVRSFRDASPRMDFEDLDEGIVITRPHFFFTDWAGLAVEASYQAQQRGSVPPPIVPTDRSPSTPESSHRASLVRFALMPFLNAGGKGDLTRPQFRLIWILTRRDEGAKALYPRDDLFSQRTWEQFIGLGVEWEYKTNTVFR